MLDTSKIGTRFAPFQVDVEKQPIRLFAKAIGETNALYFDEAFAIRAGYRSLLAPPTFLYTLVALSPDPWPAARLAGIPTEFSLHGEQSFEYFEPVVAGDVLTFTERLVDAYTKKQGRLEFVVSETSVTNQMGQLVANLRETDCRNLDQQS